MKLWKAVTMNQGSPAWLSVTRRPGMVVSRRLPTGSSIVSKKGKFFDFEILMSRNLTLLYLQHPSNPEGCLGR